LPGSSARATRAFARFRVDSNSASVRANEAYQRLVKSDVKYRFVIDMASPK